MWILPFITSVVSLGKKKYGNNEMYKSSISVLSQYWESNLYLLFISEDAAAAQSTVANIFRWQLSYQLAIIMVLLPWLAS